MPIDSTLLDGIIYTEFSGEINYDMVIKQIEFIHSLKDKVDIQYELHDHTNTEGIKLSAADIRQIAAYSLKIKDIFQHSYLAVYAPNDFTFGIARMFESIFELEAHSLNVRIFRSKEDAIRFLKDKMGEHAH